ncbi:hypothetical protein A2160_03535 [Candidatus Beckwithbacteria bacterium RBG_13_42_9]|uniref:Uncharacterized protein n=1 Tax=Candidatus Beckwithbacteria bacterium RBG_13_42_9 TaxID=1797457 RepID=A0A1F5E8N6_9BACT|nr:MAG: hypothetical protein A2160_03535 [Candidatus Beckwithbacteria bacterium RBG_13_42_9]
MEDESKKIVSGLIKYLKIREQLDLLPEVIKALEKEVLRLAPENVAQVTAAYQLTSTEKELIKTQLESVFGRKLELQLQVDPKIISGILVKVADKVIDLTISKDLEDLTKKLRD